MYKCEMFVLDVQIYVQSDIWQNPLFVTQLCKYKTTRKEQSEESESLGTSLDVRRI